MTLTIVMALGWASGLGFLSVALGSSSPPLVIPPFLLPSIGVLLALVLVYSGILVVLNRRRTARGGAITLLGLVVLGAATVGALAAWMALRDLLAPILILAWLLWPGSVLVREGVHLMRSGDIPER